MQEMGIYGNILMNRTHVLLKPNVLKTYNVLWPVLVEAWTLDVSKKFSWQQLKGFKQIHNKCYYKMILLLTYSNIIL